MMDEQKLLTPRDVADRLGIKIQTLAAWRTSQRYPLPYVKIGRLVRYRIENVLGFERQRLNER